MWRIRGSAAAATLTSSARSPEPTMRNVASMVVRRHASRRRTRPCRQRDGRGTRTHAWSAGRGGGSRGGRRRCTSPRTRAGTRPVASRASWPYLADGDRKAPRRRAHARNTEVDVVTRALAAVDPAKQPCTAPGPATRACSRDTDARPGTTRRTQRVRKLCTVHTTGTPRRRRPWERRREQREEVVHVDDVGSDVIEGGDEPATGGQREQGVEAVAARAIGPGSTMASLLTSCR